MVASIKKRDSRIVPFDVSKIAQAVFKSASSQGGDDYAMSQQIAGMVKDRLDELYGDATPGGSEQIQDMVEKTLIETGHARTAKAYILYRHQRTRVRERTPAL